MIKIYLSYLFKKINLSYLPIKLWIELTNHCNLKCNLCPNQKIPSSDKGYMDWDTFKKIIDEAEGKVRDLNLFHRGESFLHPRLFDMIEYASSKGFITKIHTNATLITPKNIEKILDSGLSYISFSFDGYSKSTYEKNRGDSSYEKTLNGIIEFLKAKKEKHCTKPYTVLQIMEYDNNLSKRDFKIQRKNFIRKLKSLPLDRFVVRTPHNWGGLITLEQKSEYENDTEKDKYQDKKLKHKIPKPKLACTFPWYALVILYDGTVLPCPQDFNARLTIGNIKKQSLEEIFNGKSLKELRFKFKNRDIENLKPCVSCDRIYRKTFLGLPTDYLFNFIRDNILFLKIFSFTHISCHLIY
ncbi:MAG: SPASM domain-containing protein [Actinobacteria bacterium]|nr:SPASM domain-containing protein [Actinomycetota bacterium]